MAIIKEVGIKTKKVELHGKNHYQLLEKYILGLWLCFAEYICK